MIELKDWIEHQIEHQHELLDNAKNQSLPEIKFRVEGFLEALYCVQDFINYSEMK